MPCQGLGGPAFGCVNLVCLCQPPLSGGRAPRRWGLVQRVGVGRLSTSCVCANLPCLVGEGPEGGGWSRGWGLDACQPRVSVPTSPVWWAPAQKVGVGPGGGGWTPVILVCLCQPPLSGGQGTYARAVTRLEQWAQPHRIRPTEPAGSPCRSARNRPAVRGRPGPGSAGVPGPRRARAARRRTAATHV